MITLIRCVVAAGAACALLILSTSQALADPALSSALVASGFTKSLYVTHAPGDYTRLFVVEQGGKIKIIQTNQNNAVRATPFLDITSLTDSAYLEYGLLGMCFHPNYQQNGYFYVAYTVGNSNLSDPVIARYKVSADPNVADPTSRYQILRIPYTIKQHRSGWLDFGPDGYLYVATGDGGENDPSNAGSDLSVLKGKILRLDVNGPDGIPGTADDDGFPADANKNYVIPASNPFLHTAGAAQEIWCYGLRNPWRAGFDRMTGDFFVGDVGQSQREEIDYVGAGRGGVFFGWRCREGTVSSGLSGCTGTLPPSELPIKEYDHLVGTAIIGGYVYRGCAIPGLEGTYFYGDWNGKVFSFRYNGSTVTGAVQRTEQTGGVSFGEDAFGEIYMVLLSGTVRKIIPAAFIGPDCNHNLRNDQCDLLGGFSVDANHNGILDECEIICPTISQPPTTATVYVGQTATLTVGATGTAPFTYQWRQNGQPLVDGPGPRGTISGATESTLTITNSTATAGGNYDVQVSNSCTTATSGIAQIKVSVNGDANCDGHTDNFDIDGFVAALIDDSAAYITAGGTAECLALKNLWGDVDHSGAFDNFDIDPFVSCIIHGQSPCP